MSASNRYMSDHVMVVIRIITCSVYLRSPEWTCSQWKIFDFASGLKCVRLVYEMGLFVAPVVVFTAVAPQKMRGKLRTLGFLYN